MPTGIRPGMVYIETLLKPKKLCKDKTRKQVGKKQGEGEEGEMEPIKS